MSYLLCNTCYRTAQRPDIILKRHAATWRLASSRVTSHALLDSGVTSHPFSSRTYSTDQRNLNRNSLMQRNVFRASLSKGQSLTNRNPNSTQLVLTACLSAGSVATYYKDNWFRIPVLVGVLFLCYIQFYKTRKREEKRLKALAANPAEVEVDDYLAYLYQFLPLRTGSRVVGFVGERELPRPVLNPILNFYCWYFNVNLGEAVQESLDAYRTLGDFFQRELKPTVRKIDRKSPLVIPCDGRVLHYGKCEDGVVEQVKGVRYPVERFLGCHPQLSDPEANDLFYCVLYLAPGDYHLFHSPCSWSVDKVIHFPGTLMSVNPSVCRIVPNILTLNERVLMSGSWEHGYFSYTAVGATNVGSIRINFLKDKIKTNKGFLSFEKDTEIEIEPKKEMGRGEMVGGFNFGSTIVLMFEAPKSFEFNFKAEQVIRLGSALGHVPGTEYPSEEEEPEETNCDQIAFQIIDELKESINEVVHETQETVNEVVLETQDTFNEVFNDTQDTFNEVVHETEELFQEVTHAICKFDQTDIMKSSDVIITGSKPAKGVES
ncbi:phosphatidylserine decarboxylase proenzyme, mitochondrial-like isoform X1 [Bolinopsis microptera]|uniref:phosphatidylserine decarboxylase proenzyme, mitochondrial-like isoform X1 n=1 Tax=Bolinopsis microptera TaxID=2820187 RepID=UPI00307A6AC2